MALLLKITLADTSKPPVWRKILIDEKESFQTLHDAIQAAFGWHDAHLWEFSPKPYQEPRIGPIMEDPFMEDMMGGIKNAAETLISTVFDQPKKSFHYVYDMGDNWVHKIVLEKILDQPAPFPTCTGGKGTCPPEDCGGIPGYYMLVKAINDPKHPNHEDIMEWMGFQKGDKWELDSFDLEDTLAYMKKLFEE